MEGLSAGAKESAVNSNRYSMLDPRFECPICLSCLQEPYLTSCGHRFCHKCISAWMEKRGCVCPIDGIELKKETDLFLDNYTKREIINQLIKCPHPNCKEITPLLEYDQHLANAHEIVNSATSKSEMSEDEEGWSSPSKHQSKADDATKLLIKTLFERLVILEQKSLQQEVQIRNANEKIIQLINEKSSFESDLPLRICNGNYIWKIPDMRGKIRIMCKDSSNMFYSEGFYTSYTGYKFCARIHISPQQKYLSLLIHMMKGDYDSTLSWPFSGRISFTLIHPTNSLVSLRETMCSRPDVDAFKRPIELFNKRGFGYPEFILLSNLTLQRFFNEDDSVILKIEINVV